MAAGAPAWGSAGGFSRGFSRGLCTGFSRDFSWDFSRLRHCNLWYLLATTTTSEKYHSKY